MEPVLLGLHHRSTSGAPLALPGRFIPFAPHAMNADQQLQLCLHQVGPPAAGHVLVWQKRAPGPGGVGISWVHHCAALQSPLLAWFGWRLPMAHQQVNSPVVPHSCRLFPKWGGGSSSSSSKGLAADSLHPICTALYAAAGLASCCPTLRPGLTWAPLQHLGPAPRFVGDAPLETKETRTRRRETGGGGGGECKQAGRAGSPEDPPPSNPCCTCRAPPPPPADN